MLKTFHFFSCFLLLSLLVSCTAPASPPVPSAAPILTSAVAITPQVNGVVASAQPPTAIPNQVHPATYLTLAPVTQSNAVYQRLELSIASDGVFTNPFDPAEVDLRVHFTAPDGTVSTAPAFWYQDYNPNSLAAQGPAGWRVRFTPASAGAWQAQAELVGKGLTSQPVAIQVSAPDPQSPNLRGFIQRDPHNSRYLAYDDGTAWFPIGLNMGWGSSSQLADFKTWLDHLSQNGGNVIRVWMASWSFGIEWKDTGLGDYTKRLDRAYELDQVFQMAEQRGIKIELVLLNHGAFSATVNPEWQDCPYNQANGGMCQTPDCFAADAAAQSFFQRRLRYIAARYAYSPALFAWEWWNEADWTPISYDQMSAWIKIMTPVLRQFDPAHHLISISYAMSSAAPVANLPEIDFAQLHLYDSSDPVLNFPDLYRQWTKDVPGKPILFAEFGASAGGEDTRSIDRQGLHLHNGLWAAAFSGFASSAMYWWWDSFVEPLNLWPQYRNLALFLDGENLSTLQPSRFRMSNTNVPDLALKSDRRALVYIHDRKYTVSELQNTYERLALTGSKPGSSWVYQPDALNGLSINVREMQDGAYTVRFYNPSSGAWLGDPISITLTGGQTSLSLPSFVGDLAVKILPAP